jgi:nitroimidazol reductase NimA-like FMN-containing flavoprotein (pyridoxamine 5'-phosphate oxidase superfamily)
MNKSLNFDEVKEEKVKFLEQNNTIVLATSQKNTVTARTVNYASEGLTIIIFTADYLKKIAQIKANSKVALCLNNVTIEGTAEIVGSSQKEEYKRLVEIHKKKNPNEIEWWSAHYPKGLVFVKVTPTLIESYVSKDNKPALEYLDLHKKRAYLTIPWEEQE